MVKVNNLQMYVTLLSSKCSTNVLPEYRIPHPSTCSSPHNPLYPSLSILSTISFYLSILHHPSTCPIGSYYRDKYQDQKQLGGGQALFSSYVTVHCQGKPGQELKTRTWRQELKQRPWASTAYWLAPHGFYSPGPPA